MNIKVQRVLMTVVLSLFALESPIWGQFEELMRRAPSSTNAIVLVNMDKVFSSQAAALGGWRESRAKMYASGITFLPPNAKYAVLASQLDFDEMKPQWEVAVVKLNKDPSFENIPRVANVELETFGNYLAMALPGDALAVNFGNRLVAAHAPKNRQAAGRWLRETEGRNDAALSPYLMEASSFATDVGTPVVMAVDLEFVAYTSDILRNLEVPEIAAELKGENLEKLATFLSTIRGVTLGITLRAQPFGKVKVDFPKDVPFSPAVGKTLLIHAMKSHGVMIDEFEDWTAVVKGKQLTLEGKFNHSGLQRISSLFDRPPDVSGDASKSDSESDDLPQAKDIPVTETRPVVIATKRYFTELTRLLKDLEAKPNNSGGAQPWSQVGVWCKNYARKVERLPTLNVDPDLLQWSNQICETLRGMHRSIQVGYISGTMRAGTVPSGYESYGYGYGYNTSTNEKNRALREETSKGVFSARQQGEVLYGSVAQIRRRLTDKYMVQF